MIFPNLELEAILQVNDRTRISAVKSFVSKDEAAITLVEIEPEAGSGFVDVTGLSFQDWFLDWEYATDGTKTVQVRITTDGLPVTKSSTIDVISLADDNLFSSDSDLVQFEAEILDLVPEGKNSFLNVHRKAQALILDELDERGIQNQDGTRITKDQVVDVQEVNSWSIFYVLHMIFNDVSNSVDDKFSDKAQMYKSKMNFHRDDAFIRLDLNKDSELSQGEQVGVRSGRLLRL